MSKFKEKKKLFVGEQLVREKRKNNATLENSSIAILEKYQWITIYGYEAIVLYEKSKYQCK